MGVGGAIIAAAAACSSRASAQPVVARGVQATAMRGAEAVVPGLPVAAAVKLTAKAGLLTVRDVAATKELALTIAAGCARRAKVWVRVDHAVPLLVPVGSADLHTVFIPIAIAAGTHTFRLRTARLHRHRSACASPAISRLDFMPASAAARPLLGSAMRSQDPAANSLVPVTSDPRYDATFVANFDSLTPENELKMLFTEPTEGAFDFEPADSLVSLAVSTGKQLRGHTLIWSGELPAWLTKPLLPWTPEALLAVMRQYIATVMQHYGSEITTWDVVNEAFQDDGSYAQNVWYDVLGPSYIADAYEIAHQAEPTAELFYNDIGAEASNPKQQAILAMVKALQARGIEIDGIGLENHTNVPGYPGDPLLEQTMSEYAALGLRVEITEMDVETQGTAPADAPVAQADAYRAAATACWDIAACQRFTSWGFSDAVSWLGAQQAPDLFDVNFQPKPAFAAVQSALFRGAFAPPVHAATGPLN